MADDELHAVADELVGDRHALLRIGDVVARLDHELLAEDAAGLVDVLRRLLDALGQLGAERGVGAGDRAGDADLDLGLRRGRAEERQSERKSTQRWMSPHVNLQIQERQLAC